MPPDPTPPVPVFAQIVDATKVMTVTFDQPLQPGASNPGNWTCSYDPGPFKLAYNNPAPAVIAGNTVTAQMVFSFPSGGPPVCDYLAAPPDVIGMNGLPAAAFVGYHLDWV